MTDLGGHELTISEETFKAGTVLVAEDEALVRLILAEELRFAGYDVIEAGNADEAIAFLDAGLVPDLLLTDVNMPGSRDGIGLARVVRERLPGTRIVVVSSVKHHAPGLIDASFLKPYFLPHLLASVAALISNGKAP